MRLQNHDAIRYHRNPTSVRPTIAASGISKLPSPDPLPRYPYGIEPYPIAGYPLEGEKASAMSVFSGRRPDPASCADKTEGALHK
jgi:hypothetical protein